MIISCVHPRFIGEIHVDHHFLCSPPVYWLDTCGSSFPVFTPGLLVGYMWIIIFCVHPRFIGGIHVDYHFLCSPPVYWWDKCGSSFPVFTPVYWWDTCGSSFPVFTPCLLVGYMWIIISCVHPVFMGGIYVDDHFLCSPPVYW